MLKVELSSPLPSGFLHHHHHHHHQPPRQARSSSRSTHFTFPDVAPVAPKRPSDGPHSLESPAKKQSKWSASENAIIIDLRAGGMKWEDISKKLPGRSAISCRLHYQNFLERKPEWDEEKKNKLARLYERFKDNMWKDVAKELQMPWRAVEAMHWQIGAQGMADRAGVAVFSTHTPSAPPQQPVKAESETPSRLAPSHLIPTPHPQFRQQQASNSPLQQSHTLTPSGSQTAPILPAYHGPPPPHHHRQAPPPPPTQHHHPHPHQQPGQSSMSQSHPQQPRPDGLARQDSLLAPKMPASAVPSRLSPHPQEVRPHHLMRHMSQPDLNKPRDRDFRPLPLLSNEPVHRPPLLPTAGHVSPYDGPRLPPLSRSNAVSAAADDDNSNNRPRLPPLRMSTGDVSILSGPVQMPGTLPEEPRRRDGDGYWWPSPRSSESLRPHILPPPQAPPPNTPGQRPPHSPTKRPT